MMSLTLAKVRELELDRHKFSDGVVKELTEKEEKVEGVYFIFYPASEAPDFVQGVDEEIKRRWIANEDLIYMGKSKDLAKLLDKCIHNKNGHDSGKDIWTLTDAENRLEYAYHICKNSEKLLYDLMEAFKNESRRLLPFAGNAGKRNVGNVIPLNFVTIVEEIKRNILEFNKYDRTKPEFKWVEQCKYWVEVCHKGEILGAPCKFAAFKDMDSKKYRHFLDLQNKKDQPSIFDGSAARKGIEEVIRNTPKLRIIKKAK